MAGTNGRTNGAVVPPFAHLDVQSAYSASASPSSPDDYVRALVRQHPLDESSARAPRTAAKARGQAFDSAVARCRTPGVEECVSSEPEPVDPSQQTNPVACCWCRTASTRCYPLPRLRHVTVCRTCYRHITGVEPETD